MKRPLVIADLSLDHTATLTQAQMQRIVGGRAVVATIDGGPGRGTIDDWQMNIAIFEGRVTSREVD
jgi:hypothetical protein